MFVFTMKTPPHPRLPAAPAVPNSEAPAAPATVLTGMAVYELPVRERALYMAAHGPVSAGHNSYRGSRLTMPAPTLAYLERAGFVAGRIGNEGSRWYEITDAGRAELARLTAARVAVSQ